MFTRQHYEAIAEILKEAGEDWQGGTPTECIIYGIRDQLADYFAQDNERFDREKFLEACGL